MANESRTVTSHTRCWPRDQGSCVIPSSRSLSLRERLRGSLELATRGLFPQDDEDSQQQKTASSQETENSNQYQADSASLQAAAQEVNLQAPSNRVPRSQFSSERWQVPLCQNVRESVSNIVTTREVNGKMRVHLDSMSLSRAIERGSRPTKRPK